MRLALKRFRGEPAITEFDWHFTPIHSSSQAFSTTTWFGPPPGFNPASPWPWIAHPVSGQPLATCRPLQTRFRCGSGPLALNLATKGYSPVRSTKSTPSEGPKTSLRLLVGTRFQVLFHSPPGVLFTFPSRYWFTIGRQEYLALERGRPSFTRDFTCPALLKVGSSLPRRFRIPGCHRLWRRFPADFC